MTTPPGDAVGKVEAPVESWTDDLLLLAISESPLSPAHRTAADAAFTIFFTRWEIEMDRHVELICKFPPANAVGIDNVLSELWQRVYKYASSYRDDGAEGAARDRLTLGWLKRIATNVLLTLQAEHDRRKLCDIPDDEHEPAVPIPANLVGDDPRQLAVAECLRRLTEREVDVLRTSADYLGAESQADGLPAHLRDELCTRYGITNLDLRQIRSRAQKKLKACVEPKLRALDERG